MSTSAPKCLTPERWAGLTYELSDPAREGVAYAYSAPFLRRTGRAVRHKTSDQPGGPRDQSVGTGLACVRGQEHQGYERRSQRLLSPMNAKIRPRMFMIAKDLVAKLAAILRDHEIWWQQEERLRDK